MDMGNTKGLFGFPPEYIHTLLNPLPTYGVAIGIFGLLVGLVFRSVATRNAGLVVIFVCTGIAWAVFVYGQHAFNHLYPDLDAESKKLADIHMDRAESFIWAFYITAVLSLIALAVPKFSREKVVSRSVANEPQAPDAKQTREPVPVMSTRVQNLSATGTLFAVIVLICAIICLGLGGWISRAGGRIRHTEFREHGPTAPASTTEPHEHHHD